MPRTANPDAIGRQGELPFDSDYFAAEDIDVVTSLYQTYKYYKGSTTFNTLQMTVTLTYDANGNVLTAQYLNPA